MTTRKATESDSIQIASLYKGSFPEHIMVKRGVLTSPDYIAEKLANQDEDWAVEDLDGELRGVAALATVPVIGLGEIERVCVAREHRGNGIALDLCGYLLDCAKNRDLGFVEAFARGNQPSMQRTFEKLGFRVYGVSPRFEVVHDGKVVREQFVHMGLELKPETIDTEGMVLIPAAKRVYDQQRDLIVTIE